MTCEKCKRRSEECSCFEDVPPVPMDDRENGRDVISQMSLARNRPDVLRNALLDMGITQSGDEPIHEEEL